ncbi:MAG TPA: hypothetical protein VIW92_03135, partial [Thermoanaerobaculia bacterium]
MPGRILEITLESLQVRENGEITRQEGRNLLSVSLVYPAPGKPLVTTVKPLRLGDNGTLDLTNAAYADRILFKEEVVGPTVLVAQLTDVEVPSRFTKFLAGLFSTAFKAAFNLFAPGGSNLILAAVADSVAALHLETLELPEEGRLFVIGQTSVPIEPGSKLPSGPQALMVPADVVRDR